jgi:antitoxin (DNA-binding transcriptional repressor) of toxin-antitoxin stability system
MSAHISIEEAQAKLPEIIGQLAPGEEIVITKDQRPIAKLHSIPLGGVQPQFGGCRGMLTVVSEDDEHLQDFREYMP